MKHLQQPKNTNQCGQTCVAMLTGRNLDTVCQILKYGKTSTKQLRTALDTLGYTLHDLIRAKPTANFGIEFEYTTRPILARVRWDGFRNKAHWIVIDGKIVHDPECGFAMDHETYLGVLRRDYAYITTYGYVVKKP